MFIAPGVILWNFGCRLRRRSSRSASSAAPATYQKPRSTSPSSRPSWRRPASRRASAGASRAAGRVQRAPLRVATFEPRPSGQSHIYIVTLGLVESRSRTSVLPGPLGKTQTWRKVAQLHAGGSKH